MFEWNEELSYTFIEINLEHRSFQIQIPISSEKEMVLIREIN